MINCEKSKNHIKNLIPTNFLYFSHEKGEYFRNFVFIIITLKNNQNFCRTQACDFDDLFWITWKVFMISKYCCKYMCISMNWSYHFFQNWKYLFLIKFEPDTYIVDMKPNLPYYSFILIRSFIYHTSIIYFIHLFC